MADKLTPQQKEAVVNRGGQLLVSAAAGSGKTKVLVDRLLGYLTDPSDPADLDEFLIITYTKAAATELRGKIAAKLTERIALDPQNKHLQKQMQRLFLTKISTVHGFCGDILREYAYKLDLSADFRIADENECREIRDQVMTDLLDNAYRQQQANPDFRAFVDSQGLGRTDKLVPEIIEKVYDSARCHKNPDAWLDNCLHSSNIGDLDDAGQTVWGRYLMDDLFAYLDCQLTAFRECCRRAEEYPEYDKVSNNLNTTLRFLEALRGAKTWDEIVANRTIQYGRLVFPKNNPDLDLSERIKAIRGGCKEGLEKKLEAFADPSEQVLADLRQSQACVNGLVSLVRQFGQNYASAKKHRRCLDFGDLEHKTLDLLLGKSRSMPTSTALEIGKRFREIMVDEYQDSNGVQDAIFSALTDQRSNAFYVGDVKQSIYQFRLADPGIFLDKYNQYMNAEKAAPGEGRKILLSHNFRSGGEVIEAVNHVFTACMRPSVGGLVYGEGEALREGIPHQHLPDPAVELYALEIAEETYPEEAAFIAERIRKMLDSGTLVRNGDGFRPVRPEDIAILLRSPGSAAGYFQKALDAQGIRYISGSGTELLKTQEVTTIRALLQTILNPRMDIPLVTTLASPVFGFSADLLGKIRSRQKSGCFYDALLLDDSNTTRRFLLILDALRTEAQMSRLSVLIEQIFTLTRIDSIYAAMPGGAAKNANLQQFFQIAVEFEKGSVRDLAQFLEHLTALESRGISGTDTSAAGCVTIMSIHKSKGLEYPVVFLPNLSRKFNRESLRAQILCDKQLGIGVSIAEPTNRIRYPSIAKRAIAVRMAAESLSEEMRVLYVALTRARDRLIMTYASRKLDKAVKDTALRIDYDNGELLCRDAGCMGDWVLMSALQRTEAGALHAIGDRPLQTTLSDFPWLISISASTEVVTEALPEESKTTVQLPEEILNKITNSLSFKYPYLAATQAPSKQTATGRKGRQKDEEAWQNSEEPRNRAHIWRKPSFAGNRTDAVAYGNAMHSVMQYIAYHHCNNEDSIQAEIRRLEEVGLITQDQASLVNTAQLAAFFQSELGLLLQKGISHVREFKFSILDNGMQYGEGLEQEQVLLQGVVDCAIVDSDGITVLDFKTDRVTEDTYLTTAEQYRPQVEAYAQAMERIFELPVKKSYLYFFRINRFVEIS